jgi:hypothetical protein
VGVAAKTRRSNLLGGQATTEFVPLLKDADTHTGIPGQVHGHVKGLGPAANDHRIKYFVRHNFLLLERFETISLYQQALPFGFGGARIFHLLATCDPYCPLAIKYYKNLEGDNEVLFKQENYR